MTRGELLLDQLIEECAEVIQRATKAKRFGLEEVQPGQEQTNRQRLAHELNDIVGVADMLLGSWLDDSETDAKRLRVELFLKYSKQLGILKEGDDEKVEEVAPV